MPRYLTALSALTPGDQAQSLSVFGMARTFRNGYMGNYTAGVEQTFKDVVLSAAYVATVGVHLAAVISPNSYPGATAQFAPFTDFNSSGQVTGGYGPEYLMGTPSHSTYHALQISASKSSSRLGLGFQSGYTLAKGLDDTSAVALNTGGAPTGTIIQAAYQDPWNPGADKGPSTFDIAQVFTTSAIQSLPFDRLGFLHPLGSRVTSGWQVLGITTLTSGSPFTVYSGVQQTGVGTAGGTGPIRSRRRIFRPAARFAKTTSAGATTTPRSFPSPLTFRAAPGPTRASLEPWDETLSGGRAFTMSTWL